MVETIKAVIWDMGGVILRTNGEGSRQELAREFKVSTGFLYNLVFDSPSAEKATVGLISETEHWNIVADTLGLSRNRIQELQDRFWAEDIIDKNLVDFIKNLKQNYKTGLLSNAWSGARQSLYQRNDWDLVFHYSMFSYEVRMRKPDAQIYEKILELMGVKANEAIFVDDLVDNINGASEVGICGIQYKSTQQAILEVTRLLSTQA
jgi:glucose-1-phosphatase